MSIQERFLEFHRNNPMVYALLVQFARELTASGRTKSGIKMVWERMRWEMTINPGDQSSPFRLNNDYTSRYARLIMQRESDLKDFFEVRDLRAA